MDLAPLTQIVRGKFPDSIVEEQSTALVIKKEFLLKIAEFLKGEELLFENMHCISGVDRKDKIEVVYHLYSFKNRFMLTLKVFLPRENPEVETLTKFWRSADWLEREVFDLFGVKFLNHPDPRRILNPDEWTYYPLRKDFTHPEFFPKAETQGLKG
ncbi:MAG: NADH-quinone oxidoreductase subunit C [Candidatus Omnitrophota bacterium]